MDDNQETPQIIELPDGVRAQLSLDPNSPKPPFEVKFENVQVGELTQPKDYFFVPAEDITPYELARCTMLMVSQLAQGPMGDRNWYIKVIEALPDNIRRHWTDSVEAAEAASVAYANGK